MMIRRCSVAAVVALLGGRAAAEAKPKPFPDALVRQFEDFLRQYGKTYPEEAEFQARFAAFAENLRRIEVENGKGTNQYVLGLTEFADMTPEEFRRHYLGFRPAAKPHKNLAHLGTYQRRNITVPASLDWREKGAVTPVKNQQQCGSCWAFSTTGALEGAYQIATGKLVSLSEQQLVDCAQSFGEEGCAGGEMDTAFQYAQQSGLDTEASYTYQAKDGICKAASGTIGLPKGAVTGFQDVTPNDQQALTEAVVQQPVSIAIEADQTVFQLYRGGIITGACGTNLDHGVLLIGYGTDKGQDYWLIKNSWGTSWGEQGFGRLLRGKSGPGECGIKMQPSFPVIAKTPVTPDPILRQFENFLREFGKVYAEEAEFQARFAAFVENVRYIAAENAKGTNTYRLGLTEFADMTREEFRSKYLGFRPKARPYGSLAHLGTFRSKNATVPSSLDWRQKGAVTPVKNQGQCGSCWAFSTTGALEGAYQIATGKLVSLSEQQLVDCSQSFGEEGCKGGEMDTAFQYVQQNGLDTEDSYSYQAKDGICKAASGTIGLPKGVVTGFHDVTPSDQQALTEAVVQQPVSVAIEADQGVFQLYTGGIISGACGTNLDHGVLLVGYGTDKGQDYWIIKNSWGTSWGEQGFGRLLRGQSGPGECGIKMDPSFPVISASPARAPGAPESIINMV